MAENDVYQGYRIGKRELDKREMRRLLISERLSTAEIAGRLNLSQRTVERYLSQIFKEDNKILLNPSAEEIATEISKFRQKLAWSEQDLVKRLEANPNADFVEVVQMHDLLSKIGWAGVKLTYLTPAQIVRYTTSLDQVLDIKS